MKRTLRPVPLRLALAGAALLATASPLVAHGLRLAPDALRTAPAHPVSGADSAEVAATVERYHRALERGDSAAALSLLTPDAVILESGGMETRAEYRSHHLQSDIEFARAVSREPGETRVRVEGDVAWTTSVSTVRGEFRGRAVHSRTAELMVLTRTAEGWRIAAIHWSSRSRRP